MGRVSTSDTAKGGLIRTVPILDGAAPVAHLRCVSRINQDDRHPTQLRFVGQVVSKLEERPVAVFSTCRFPNRLLSALANVRQIFNRKRTVSAFGFLYQLLVNGVVGIRLKAALSTTERVQAAFGAFCPNGLQAITTALVSLADTFNRCPAVAVTVAIRRKVGDTEINAQRRVNSIRRWLVNITRHQQVELPLAIDQIAFTLSGLQPLALTLAAHKRNGLTVVVTYCPDGNHPRVKIERQNTIIIRDAAMRSVRALHLPIQFVAITDFGKARDDHLCRQAVLSFDALVHQLLQIVLPKYPLVACHAADLITRGVRRFKHALQDIGLFRRGLQLDLGDDLHILSCSTLVLVLQANVWSAAVWVVQLRCGGPVPARGIVIFIRLRRAMFAHPLNRGLPSDTWRSAPARQPSMPMSARPGCRQHAIVRVANVLGLLSVYTDKSSEDKAVLSVYTDKHSVPDRARRHITAQAPASSRPAPRRAPRGTGVARRGRRTPAQVRSA